MLFNSIHYLVFFPIAVLFYFLLPQKVRNFWLLILSYYFYMCWNAKYAFLLFGSTCITYLCGLVIGYLKSKNSITLSKYCVALSFSLNLSILFFFKYANFFIDNFSSILNRFHIDMTLPHFSFLLPVGISFYIFQALSYTMDVYRGDLKPTRNFFKYALFVSFFPQLVAGPIERSTNLLSQFDKKQSFDVDRVRSGLLFLLWGLFMKIVISDNLAISVDMIFSAYTGFSGTELAIATIFFAFQIYCDFAGYSYMAIGSAKVLGIDLMTNFHSPYLATSISDFWRRWHISLSSWFRDYLYIPLGGSRKGKLHKYINTFLVFLVSGLWHGAAWNYIIWGALNGFYLIFEEILSPPIKKLQRLLKVDTSTFSYKLSQRIITFSLICISWIFFRVDGFRHGLAILKIIFTDFKFNRLFEYIYEGLGLPIPTLFVLCFSLLLLLAVDILHYKNISIDKFLFKQGFWFRYFVYTTLLLLILNFGIYGHEYEQAAFIYFQF